MSFHLQYLLQSYAPTSLKSLKHMPMSTAFWGRVLWLQPGHTYCQLGGLSRRLGGNAKTLSGLSLLAKIYTRIHSCIAVVNMTGLWILMRSAAIVAAFLMKSGGWRLAQCSQWLKDWRPQVELTDASQHELLEYEPKLFGASAQFLVPTESCASLGFGDVTSKRLHFNQMTAIHIVVSRPAADPPGVVRAISGSYFFHRNVMEHGDTDGR